CSVNPLERQRRRASGGVKRGSSLLLRASCAQLSRRAEADYDHKPASLMCCLINTLSDEILITTPSVCV
uniref:Uncharacterized protein n=1 Tax=Oryza brachyantha TaxID=4533 RepID=J3M9D0_ORYBR